MEAKGTVIQVMPTESGTSQSGKDWRKTTFIIETNDAYPKKIAIDVLGDKIKLPNVGEEVTASLNIESRESITASGTQYYCVEGARRVSNRHPNTPTPGANNGRN